MGFLARIKDACINFLFPKSEKIIALESLTSDEILRILPPAVDLDDKNTIALFDYGHPLVREIIWSIKYRGDRHLAEKIADVVADTIEQEVAERSLYENLTSEGGSRPILIPMPVSDKRRFDRGWNQVELVAEAVKKRLGHGVKYLPNQLVKFRHTESQTQTGSKRERQENLTGTMKILHPPAVAGRAIILLDDVTTTGSTFKEARRALKEAGAKKIICFAIAH